MPRAIGIVVAALLVASRAVKAENGNEVIADSDVALTGGAVVANVHSGGALWYNPAGVARFDKREFGLTGALLSYNLVHAPGTLSIEDGGQSPGDFSFTQAIPRAITFVASPQEHLRFGVGLFFSRSFDRFVQDSVSSASGSESAELLTISDERQFLYHVSSAVAWNKSDKLLLGGGLDVVIASNRFTELISGGYDGGQGGAFDGSVYQKLLGSGLQMKAGLQWAPIKEIRVGWMVATPSYLFYVSDKTTQTQTLAPPDGTPSFTASEPNQIGGTWAGVEAGLSRLGVAYLRPWGWIESDLVISFPLETSKLGIDWKTTTDAHVGGIFKVTDRLQVGAGFFTNFSPDGTPDEFGENQIDFYGFTMGIDFANRSAPPKKGEKGLYMALAAAFRYAHGSGTIAGFVVPSTYPDPPSQPGEINLVGVEVNEIGFNIAIKAGF